MRAQFALALTLAILCAAGCSPVATPRSCSLDGDCASGSFCLDGLCVITTGGPAVVIDSPADDALVTSATFKLSGSVTDASGPGVSRVEYTLNGMPPVVVDLDDSTFSLELETPRIDHAPTTVTVTAIDRLGKPGSARVLFVADRVGPRIAVTSPATTIASRDAAGLKLTWEGSATDGSGTVARTEYSIDDGTTWLAFDDPMHFRFDYTVPADCPGLSLVLRIRAVDPFGNASDVWSAPGLNVDTLAPRLDLTSPTDKTIIAGPDTLDTLLVEGTVDEVRLHELAFTLDWQPPPTPIAVAAGAFSIAIPLPAEDYSQHTVQVIAKDEAGNETRETRTFFVDRSPPQIALSGLDESTGFSASMPNVVQIALVASDGALASVGAALDGSPVTLEGSDGTFTLTILLDDEDHRARILEVTAVDAYGLTTTLTRHFAVDRLPPRVELSEPHDGALFNFESPPSLTIAGSIDEGDLASVSLLLDSSPGIPLDVVEGKFEHTLALGKEDAIAHQVELVARDGVGNVARVAHSFTVDRVAPSLQIAGPVDGSVLNAAEPDPIVFTGTVHDAVFAELSWQQGANAFIPIVVASNAFSQEWHLGTLDWSAADIVFRARDHAGNETRLALHYFVDRAPPVSTCALDNGLVVPKSAPGTLAITGQVTDAALDHVTAQVDSAPEQVLTIGTDGYEYPYALADEDWTDHTFTLIARDRAGNDSTLTRTFTVDRVAPALSLASPQGLVVNASTSPSVEIRGTATDARLVSVRLREGNGAPSTLAVAPGPFSTTLSIAGSPDFQDHAITVTATDAAGNETALTDHYTVDRLPPRMALIGFEEGTIVPAGAARPLIVCGTVQDAAPMTLTVSHDGAGTIPLAIIDGAFCFSVASALEDGATHRFELVVRDSAGNEARLARSYVVDRVQPQLTITSPATNAACTSVCTGAIVSVSTGASLTVSGSVQDGGGIAIGGVKMTVDGVQFVATVSNGTWSAVWSPIPNDAGAMHSLRVEAIDRAGNQSIATRDVWVDRVAPTAVSTSEGQRLVERTGVLVAFSEPMDVASVIAATRVNGAAPGPSFGSADGISFRFSVATELTPYSVTDLQINATARDRAGNALSTPVAARFLTQPVLPSTAMAIATGQQPAIALDADGLPVVAAWTASGFKSFRWDGRGAFVGASIPVPVSATSGRIDDFAIVRMGASGLAVTCAARALLSAQTTSGTQLLVAESADLTSWRGHVAASADVIAPMAAWSRASLMPPYSERCLISPPSGSCSVYEEVAQEGVRYATTSSAVVEQLFTPTGLGAPTTVYSSGFSPYALRGAALVSYSLFYAPTAIAVLPMTNPTLATCAGRTAVIEASTLASVSGVRGSAHVVSADIVGTQRLPEVRLACAAQPEVGSSWKVSAAAGPALTASQRVTALALELSASIVALGLETADGQTWLGTTPNTSCTSAPAAPTWTQLPSGTSQLALAPSATGVWKTWVSSGTVWLGP